MLLWFIGTAVLSVWYVFRDVRFDFRFLAVGSLVPDIIDLPSGHARWAHSLVTSVGVMVVVMLATVGRRAWRKRLLAVPIGMMMHLVWDGAFSTTKVFWWPFTGSWGDVRVPTLQRGWWNVALEVLGAAMLVWAWRRFGLADPARRQALRRTGTVTDAPVDVVN